MKAYDHPRFRKGLLSFLLLALLVSVQLREHTAATLETPGEPTSLDQRAMEHLDGTFQQALIAFGAAKALNATISLIQETSVQVSPFGVGIDLAVGQVLDPVNDMAERASWIFLASMTSVGIQKFILALVPWVSLQVILSLGLAVLALGLWRPHLGSFNLLTMGAKLILAALVLRLLIPVSVLAFEFIDARFTPAQYARSLEDIEATKGELESLQQALTMQGTPPEDASAWDRAMEWKRTIKEEFGKAEEKAEQTMDRFINLITLFVIRTIVLPLATLWILLGALKWTLGRKEPFGFEQALLNTLNPPSKAA
ncbi:hypothetical protein [Salidesulfovibrio onnuriiensis]|uniref:hypothetical protein n=1 Tax=Salidesulfovibrio onnuriiensis TaxID=2583823 RepID=UPI0011C6EF7C|nr:hypothetical protein [Salidesulfovibrio onnuriiensis]